MGSFTHHKFFLVGDNHFTISAESLDKGTFTYYVSKRVEGGGSRNAYARVRNQESHSIMHVYRGEGGLKKIPEMPYVISERSLNQKKGLSMWHCARFQ